MNNLEEYKNYIIQLYDNYIYCEELRGISYGEIAYIESLDIKQLKELEIELTGGDCLV